ncbi:MAG: lysophospholipid acyltransferase family protein [Desulfobacteraceae bacterium]|nr:lysophospholipid acyltransferase family protein [Desulfobacteraceae bacterium]
MRQHAFDSPLSYYAIYYTVRYLPRRICRLLGHLVGRIIYIVSKNDCKNLARNFSLALGKPVHHPDVRKAVRGIFLNYSRYMIDYFLFPQLDAGKVKSYFSTIRGQRVLDQSLAKGKGVILVSAHVGNWEIGGNLLRVLNYPLTVVGLPHNTDRTNMLVTHLRKIRGIDIIEVGQSTLCVVPIIDALRKNRIVAMIGDRDHLGTGRPVNFLNTQICLPIGPIVLAMISGAALIPTFVIEKADGTYYGVLEQPLPIQTSGDRDHAIDCNLRRLAAVFETYIRRYPDQWYCPDPLISKPDNLLK